MIKWPTRVRLVSLIGMCALAVFVTACGTGSGGGGGTPGTGSTPTAPTATPTPTCGTHATASAVAYDDSAAQVVGEIPPGSSVTDLSHFVYPLGIADEGAVGNAPAPSYIAISPDAAHLAVAITQIIPFFAEYTPYIVDTSTHAATAVPLPSPIKRSSLEFPMRLFAWANPHTVVIFTGSNAETYDISTHSLAALPGTDGAVEGVVRCNTLYFMSYPGINASTSPVVPELVTKYDLTAHTVVGAPIHVGSAGTYGGAEGAITYGGWDVSPDGSRLAYQNLSITMTSGPSASFASISSHWQVVSTSGGAASAILPVATAASTAFMAISPDGSQVAVTNANPTPNVISGPLSGGPTRFYDSPAAYSQPAWKADSSGFYSSTGQTYGASSSVALFSLGSASHATGTTAFASGDFPATLP